MTEKERLFVGRHRRVDRHKVAIKKGKLRSEVVPSALQVWLDRGWTRVDDGNSETATKGASKKEKN